MVGEKERRRYRKKREKRKNDKERKKTLESHAYLCPIFSFPVLIKGRKSKDGLYDMIR